VGYGDFAADVGDAEKHARLATQKLREVQEGSSRDRTDPRTLV